MLYPKFIKENGTIGIVALSAGVGDKLDEFNASLSVLKANGYKIIETKSVRTSGERSNTPIIRAQELDELITDNNVDMIMLASGGDSQIETIPYIDYKHIKENPKWIMGYSDPTNLSFIVTTMLDIASIYGYNGGSFTLDNTLEQKTNLEYIKGNLFKQESYDKYIDFIDLLNDNKNEKPVYYKSNTSLNISGRCIGGCLDAIDKIIGTKYDYVSEFIDKYKDDGIVWYFDNFAMSAYNTYLTLLQFKYAGYFEHCKGVVFGRVAFANTNDSKLINDYGLAYKEALGDIPYAYDLDIGHTYPSMVMINGALTNIKVENGKGSIEFKLY